MFDSILKEAPSETQKPFNYQNINKEKIEDFKTPDVQNNMLNSELNMDWEDFFNSNNNQSLEKKSEELIKAGERKSEQFKNIYTEENQEPRVFMTNNQTKKEQEKSVLTITEFLDEELEFLKEENISIQDSDSKWSWLTNELAEKYFISVLLPYYTIKPNLSYDELYLLRFKSFLDRLVRQKIHFKEIKDRYLNLNFNMQKQIDFLSEKFGVDKAKEKLDNAKNRLDNIFGTVSYITISQNKDKIRLCLDLGFSLIKCEKCGASIDLLPALVFHHPTESKEIILKNLYRRHKEEYKIILEKFKKDKVKLLCVNDHREKQLFYPIIFRDVVFKENLFSMSAEQIDAYIDDYLSVFTKSKRHKEVLYEKYTSKNLDVPSRILSDWKIQIKTWIKKRFVFNELFSGKCVVCGDSNLLHLELHHIDPNLKDLIISWQSISHLDCDEIMHIIIKEKCVSICANCHAFINSKYNISNREVLKGFFALQEIDKISEEVTLKYNNAIEKISNFSYDLKNINFKCPLKLVEHWKLTLMTIYHYLEIKKRNFFFRNEILYDLELTPNFIDYSIKQMIDLNYIQKSDYLLKYSLTQKGIDKSSILISENSEKANEIKEKIKEFLDNKGKYEFLEYVYSNKDKCFVKRKNISKEDNIFKYCTIIYDIITTKDINEFTVRELIPFLSNSELSEKANMTAIWRTLNLNLIPSNLIEEVDNSTSYLHINRYKKEEDLKIPISSRAKIYGLNEKGFDIVKNGIESLNI